MITLTDDEVDFNAYMIEPEARVLVRPPSAWRQEVVDSFLLTEEQAGCFLPWPKTQGFFRARRGELTLWPGINGHGKSILLSQVMCGLMAQGEKVLVASMEMRPRLTLNRMVRQCRMKRECGPQDVDAVIQWAEGRMRIYDQLGSVDWRKLLAVFRWAAKEQGITHFVIDSLMRCGIREDDYSGQKDFVDALCVFKHDYSAGVHLVMHSRKRQDEFDPPGKFDAKGTGTMTDLADNCMTVWRNKRKESALETMQAKGEPIPDDVRRQPDAMLICEKQRNFDWEGKINLWYHRDSMQFVESGLGGPQELMEFRA